MPIILSLAQWWAFLLVTAFLMANPYNDPTLTSTKRSRYFPSRPQAEAVVRLHEYEDGGKSFNRLSNIAPKTWELIYNGLDFKNGVLDESAQFDDHFADHWTDTPFRFLDKAGDWHAVYYLEYDNTWDGHKSWVRQVRALLIEYPGGPDVDDLPVDSPPDAPEGFTLEFDGLDGMAECDDPGDDSITEYIVTLSWSSGA